MKAFQTTISSSFTSTATLAFQDASVWIARPSAMSNGEIVLLARLLDSHERGKAAGFHVEADRRAYVLAHGLRRLAVGQFLQIAPSSLHFSSQANGRPHLALSGRRPVFFSHSHSREVVACAVSHTRPVGIDAELPGNATYDLEWLAPYVALSVTQQSFAPKGSDSARQFLLYWTALEAFWKAAGTGLSSGNPRIICKEKSPSCFDVSTAWVPEVCPLRAQVRRIADKDGCVVSLALMTPASPAGRST